ncbi:MAG: ROK family protein [Planctomycetaceae bacterium]|nr:ROK family protein [Planctomycetaceae bacterium]
MPETLQFIPVAEAREPFFVGIDLGGTNIKFGVVDDRGRPMSWMTIPTEAERGPEDTAERMAAAVHRVIGEAGLTPQRIARVGLASAGPMDIPAGMITTPINLKGWHNAPIRDLVATSCGLPVTFENDANAAAYGEFWVGAGRDFPSLILLTLGTGIGCGIIFGDLVLRGEHSHGGESGHIILDFSPEARLCGCGRRGHLEAYASATAVIKRAKQLLESGRRSSLSDRIAGGKGLTPKLIAAEAEAGDELSLEIVLETAHYIGLGAVSLMHMLQPAGVFLGGAMTFGGHETALGRRFLEHVREEVQRLALPQVARATSIDFATLGGDAGFIGAAGVARLEWLQKQTGHY